MNKKPFVEIVDKIFKITSANMIRKSAGRAKIVETKIDQMVINFYGLTPEEITLWGF
jgi:hypothetical protein